MCPVTLDHYAVWMDKSSKPGHWVWKRRAYAMADDQSEHSKQNNRWYNPVFQIEKESASSGVISCQFVDILPTRVELGQKLRKQKARGAYGGKKLCKFDGFTWSFFRFSTLFLTFFGRDSRYPDDFPTSLSSLSCSSKRNK